MVGQGSVRVCPIGWALVAGLWSLIGSSAALGASDVTVRTVAYFGQSAPGLNQPFYTFGAPVLNDAGRVAFVGSVNNGGTDGLWSEGMATGAATLSLVAAEGFNAPETDLGTGNGPARFVAFSELVLNDAGRTAFHTTLTGTGVGPANGRAVFSQTGTGGALRKVARLGDPAPSFAGLSDVFTELRDTRLNDAGRVAIAGSAMSPGGSARGAAWWEDHTTGQLRALARQDASPPGLTPPGTFNTIHTPALNDQGQALISAEFSPGAILWSSGGKVFRSFEAVPGTTREWGTFDGTPALNNAGRLAFVASSRTAGAGGSFTEGLWTGDAQAMREVYRPGTVAPGMGAGAVFSGGSLLAPVISEKGDVAFRATVNTTSGPVGTIYTARNGGQTVELVVRAGQQAPGTPAGTVISSFPVGMEAPAFNARGTMAFIAGLAGPGVTMANDQALYAVVDGLLRLIAREGDPIQVRPGVVRTVRGLSFLSDTGNQEGRPAALNEYDQLAFTAALNDAAINAAVIVADAGLAGDVDADRDVDAADFVLLRQNFGRAGHRGQGDFNGDGRISFADFQIMERNFGKTLAMVVAAEGAGVSMVPEPGMGAIALVILSIAVPGRRGRSRRPSRF